MSDLTPVPPAPAAPSPAPAIADDAGWQPLAPAAARLATIAGALVGAPVAIAPAIGASVLLHPGFAAGVALFAVLVLAGAVAGGLLNRRRSQRTRWRLDERGLQVRRGLAWHSELLVPRSRVQHLDLERGPLERRAGLATLVVHTAGTRLHALRQSGFADADAVALRDALLPERERDDDVL